MDPLLASAGVAATLAVLLFRVFWVILFSVGRPLPKKRPGQGLRTLIVLGSGGHTAEMLNLLSALNLKDNYTPRIYVAAATDRMSLAKARTLEEEKVGKQDGVSYYSIYRSREVGQSYLTSVFTTLAALAHAAWLVAWTSPELVLCNGPGTCLPVCVMAFTLRVLGIRNCVIIFVESVARVQKLSLTGSLLYRLRIVDQFIVQWPTLKERFPRSLYIGKLM